MASRSFKKYANLGLDEEKDFFLASLNKRIRNARKKLEQIDELSKRDKSTLKAEQLEKISSKAEVLDSIRVVDDLKETYYAAYKTAKEEGKVTQTTVTDDSPATKQPEQPQKETKPVQETQVQSRQPAQTEEQRQAELARASREGLSKVLNLIHLVHFFRDQGHVQELRQAVDSRRVNLDSVPDFESLNEFYTKVFTFSESDKFVRIEDKLNRSLNELESYVNSASQPALRNQSYGFLQSVVQKVTETSFFKEHKADVSTHQPRAVAEHHHHPIGSELKKGHEQPAAQASSHHQEKLRSPEKETKAHEHTKVSPAKEAKRDWGSVEDDEEEEGLDRLREEEQQEVNFEGEGGRAVEESEKPYTTLRDKQNEEEHKQGRPADDEWSTVTVKRKEKKEEKPSRGGQGNKPYRGDGQRGDRGGQRRPRPEGEGGQQREKRPPREGQGEVQGEGEQGRGGFKGTNRGGGSRGGYQKREGQGDEYKRKEDVYQKKSEGATKTTEGQ